MRSRQHRSDVICAHGTPHMCARGCVGDLCLRLDVPQRCVSLSRLCRVVRVASTSLPLRACHHCFASATPRASNSSPIPPQASAISLSHKLAAARARKLMIDSTPSHCMLWTPRRDGMPTRHVRLRTSLSYPSVCSLARRRIKMNKLAL
jgi:hypothetical protein